MSDDKTEEPTQKKLQDAREKGQVGQSQDFNKLIIAAVVLQVLISMTEYGVDQLSSSIEATLLRIDMPFQLALKEVFKQSYHAYFGLLALTLAPAVLMRLLATWSQFGLLIAPKALIPNLSKLNPVNAAKNMFSKQKFMDLLLNIFKAGLVVLALLLVVKPSLALLFLIPHSDLQHLVTVVSHILGELHVKTLGLLFIVAGADFLLKKHFHKKGLMMSKEDVKQEFKQSQGDPHVKGQRKQLARQIANDPGKAKQPKKKPDAVVVNPTHFAVELYYRPGETPLPVILNHAQDDDAKSIIHSAHQQRIPVIRCIWLARRLCTYDVGSYIPRETLQAVAEIYHLLRELDVAGDVINLDMPPP